MQYKGQLLTSYLYSDSLTNYKTFVSIHNNCYSTCVHSVVYAIINRVEHQVQLLHSSTVTSHNCIHVINPNYVTYVQAGAASDDIHLSHSQRLVTTHCLNTYNRKRSPYVLTSDYYTCSSSLYSSYSNTVVHAFLA